MTKAKTPGVSVENASSRAINPFVTAPPFGLDLPVGYAVVARLNLFF